MIELDAWQRRRWHNASRYYEVHIHQDLWGNWLLTRIWGRTGTAAGNHKQEPVADREEALGRLAAVAACRRRRGYLPIEEADRGH